MGQQIRQAGKLIWLNIGVALLVLVLMEGVARAGFALMDRGRRPARLLGSEQGIELDANADQRVVRAYLRELREAAKAEWHPYVYWRTRPYRGEYLNINQAGVRRTWNGTPAALPGQRKIFMFGGSTLWGHGARDEFTIPSFVSKELSHQLGSGVWVVNFAENGYVSTQEVIALVLELQKGNVPDIVVFFDGVNDTFSAFQSGVAGVPQNEGNRVAEFDSLQHVNWRQAVVERLALYRLSAGVVRSLGGFRPPRLSRTEAPSADALARAVVDVYVRNVSIVDALAKRFGFRAAFFWQPTVYTKTHLSEQERQWYGQSGRRFGSGAPFFGKAYEAFQERMRTHRVDHVYDLSGVFGEVGDTVFIDEFHVSEAGNKKIAEVMAQTLLRNAREGSK